MPLNNRFGIKAGDYGRDAYWRLKIYCQRGHRLQSRFVQNSEMPEGPVTTWEGRTLVRSHIDKTGQWVWQPA